jgi:hypothetical protein
VKPVVVREIPFSVFFLDLRDDHYARHYGYKEIYLDSVGVDKWPEYYVKPRWGR